MSSDNKKLFHIDSLDLSERVENLKRTFLDTVPEISSQRARLITESYEETVGLPSILRRARALEKILGGMDIYIGEGDLLVGSLAEKFRSVPVFPEYDIDFVLDELDTFETRTSDKFLITEQTKEVLRQVLPKWRNQTLKEIGLSYFPESAASAASDLICALTALKSGVGHIIVDYESCLRKGLRCLIGEIQDERKRVTVSDPAYVKKQSYYKAAIICCEAAIQFAGRYSDLAKGMAEAEQNPERKAELLKIAQICATVPENPARDFHEACQSFWFLHLIMQLESNGHSISCGRFDRYMYPYYIAASEGPEREFHDELLACLWIKFNEINKIRDKNATLLLNGYPVFQHMSLGGQDEDGKNIVNELSRKCLDITAKIGLPQPSTSIRWHYGSPDDFLEHAIEVASHCGGLPAFFNDEVLIPNMLQAGYTLPEARDYSIVGCTETTVGGISEPWLTGGFYNILKVLELTIFDGFDIVLQKQNPFRTGAAESFATFEDFFQGYCKQLSYYFEQHVTCDNIIDELHGMYLPTPFESLFINDCIRNAKTSMEGGARHNSTTINLVGIANVADSLATIKKLIFEDRTLTWEELRTALRNNFEGSERLRQVILNKVPKYGNDEPYVDELGARVSDHLYYEYKKYRNPRGGPILMALYSVTSHLLLADKIGASADGRLFGQVLADGGVSCSQGRDKSGPTAVLKSVVRLDPFKAVGSTLLNLKFNPKVLANRAGLQRIAGLVKTFFLSKGQHIQFNFVSAETLRDAQKHPDKYPSLVVRVAGFSVLFNTIDSLLQEDIILRTEHE
ncbi:MAG: formate C-acetyltransferase/glycerol dehydratase family glycyl radical enzyme [Syntrophobacter sp.]